LFYVNGELKFYPHLSVFMLHTVKNIVFAQLVYTRLISHKRFSGNCGHDGKWFHFAQMVDFSRRKVPEIAILETEKYV